jgi:hypothetical protein
MSVPVTPIIVSLFPHFRKIFDFQICQPLVNEKYHCLSCSPKVLLSYQPRHFHISGFNITPAVNGYSSQDENCKFLYPVPEYPCHLITWCDFSNWGVDLVHKRAPLRLPRVRRWRLHASTVSFPHPHFTSGTDRMVFM